MTSVDGDTPGIKYTVEIEQSGNGGAIIYREGENSVRFGWEFAMPPAIALLFGPSALRWSHFGAWATGRQAEVFATVGAEVVRQKSPGGDFTADLDTGMIEILRAKR
jgi:hypothetical protein